MALAGKDEFERDVPHEPGNSFTFGLLSGPELDQAQAMEQKKQLQMIAGMDADVVDRIINRSGKSTAVLTDEQRDQLRERGVDPDIVEEVVRKEERAEQYHKDTLVEFGVIAWKGPKYTDDCTDKAKLTLDAQTRDWAAGVVVEMTTRTAGEGQASVEPSPLAEFQES